MNENANLGAYGLMYVVKNKRNEVISLLIKNGVAVPSNAYDIQIALLVTNLLKVSKSFYNEFIPLLLNEETVDAMSSNMSGSYANAGGNADFCKNTDNKTESPTLYKTLCGDSTATTSTNSNTSTKSSFINRGLDFLQSSVKDYLQYDDNKTKRELANASVKISENEVKKGDALPPKKGLSTGAIVGISLLGATVVGLVVYLIAKKK